MDVLCRYIWVFSFFILSFIAGHGRKTINYVTRASPKSNYKMYYRHTPIYTGTYYIILYTNRSTCAHQFISNRYYIIIFSQPFLRARGNHETRFTIITQRRRCNNITLKPNQVACAYTRKSYKLMIKNKINIVVHGTYTYVNKS